MNQQTSMEHNEHSTSDSVVAFTLNFANKLIDTRPSTRGEPGIKPSEFVIVVIPQARSFESRMHICSVKETCKGGIGWWCNPVSLDILSPSVHITVVNWIRELLQTVSTRGVSRASFGPLARSSNRLDDKVLLNW